MYRAGAIAERRELLRESQWYSKAEIENEQFSRLRALLRHFQGSSQWFQSRLDAAGVSWQDVRGPADLKRLPIATRRELQQAGDGLISQRVPTEHGGLLPFKTSGSTGRPLSVYRTDLNEIDRMAMILREHEWHQRDFSLRECGIRSHAAGAIERPDWSQPVNLFHQSAPSLILPLSWDVVRLADAIRYFRPSYLQGFPSLLAGILTALAGDFDGLADLREIRTGGEVLEPHLRQRLQEGFGVPVTDIYGAQEVGIIGCQCSSTAGYHVSSELVLVEILRPDDRPCEVGEFGRVVITDLRNFATPIIRYEIGDYAEVAPPCSCGRGARSITRILGRHRNLMVLPDGRVCWPRLGWLIREFEKTQRVTEYQLIQIAANEIEVHMVVEGAPGIKSERRFCALLEAMTSARFELKFFYYRDAIPREGAQKWEDFRNLVSFG